ncbi:MAG: hypothetical protein GX417_06965 [Clostridiales bacterium]|nr:hypothetical protein [Clostridiales bacterium]
MKLKIVNIEEADLKDVRVALPNTGSVLRRGNFEWTAFPVETVFKTNRLISGLLEGWHRMIEFDTVEYHDDAENFLFFEGVSLMLFCDREGDRLLPESMQLVRIMPGTQVEVKAGKCHYVPIPETDRFRAYVVTPLQESILIPLAESVVAE